MPDSNDAARFGEKLRTLRKANGYTMHQLKDILGYKAQSYISEIETGKTKPSIEFAIKIARLFEVSLDDLLLDERELPSSDE